MAPKQLRAIAFSNERVKDSHRTAIPWLWDGVIAENAVTLLSAPEKTGKTTLLSLLLDRRREGGMLLGRPVRPAEPSCAPRRRRSSGRYGNRPSISVRAWSTAGPSASTHRGGAGDDSSITSWSSTRWTAKARTPSTSSSSTP
jgi:hypothetical protein